MSMESFENWLFANQWTLTIIFVWDITWRIIALWHSARQNQKVWFVALMLVNSVGILPLVYLVFVSKTKFWVKDTKFEPIQEAMVVKKISPRPTRRSGPS